MERQSPQRKRRKRKRAPTSPPVTAHHLFAQMLAAYANIQSPFSQSLLLKCLRRIHSSLTHSQDFCLQEFDVLIALLPYLLILNNPKVAASCGDIIGAAALLSFDTNVKIACSKEIVNGLVTALGSCSKQVVEAACNALLDLSTTTIGQEKLQESSAVDKLLFQLQFHSDDYVFDGMLGLDQSIMVGPIKRYYTDPTPLRSVYCQMAASSAKIVSRCTQGKGISDNLKVRIVEDKLTALVVEALSVLINNCPMERLEIIPEDLLITFTSFVKKGIRKSKTIDAVMVSVLEGLVSCPPIASDELDILNFLKDVKGQLGSPVMDGQDLRVVKTVELMHEQSHFKKELHLLNDGMNFGTVGSLESIKNNYVHKCKEAYHGGYSIALRGMEFRSENVSAIADGLELLFGQPSVGANLYLTPPKSQGLAQHFDDHCVFVCQLIGKKQWAVFPQSAVNLPRLYEPSCIVLGSEDDNNGHEGKRILLNEGDILYIPRGCPHEAFTVPNDGDSQLDETTQFSLHLTLGIEVEPPFEWEGFAHIALHCWKQNKYQKAHDPVDSTPTIPDVSTVNLLHVAIRLIGDRDPTFRKACMVAAFSLPSNSGTEIPFHILDLNQRATFSYVIDRINVSSCFLEAFRTVEAAVRRKNDGPLQWMRWLRHLPHEDMDENTEFESPLDMFEKLVLLYEGHTEEVAAVFTSAKAQFCADVVFEDPNGAGKEEEERHNIITMQ
ncbi:hypothetical protein ACLOJK_030739 [Asimina triloba]